jgi:hypothetical protein
MSLWPEVDFPAGDRVKNPDMVESRPRDWLAEGDVIDSGMVGDLAEL